MGKSNWIYFEFFYNVYWFKRNWDINEWNKMRLEKIDKNYLYEE